MNRPDLKKFLDNKVIQYNQPDFIINDPVSVPHQFQEKQDIEIMGLFASLFAWGQRITIINKCNELGKRMDRAPFDFVTNHKESDLKNLLGFKHRTFNDSDLLGILSFLRSHYKGNETLETAFFPKDNMTIEEGLNHFYSVFSSFTDIQKRTLKHISSPRKKSACKRLNMYLRWMVRTDDANVDFGIWKKIKPKDLICPLDVHVQRTARKLGLLKNEKNNWDSAIELTNNLKEMDPNDPVKYDFALFGISIEEKI